MNVSIYRDQVNVSIYRDHANVSIYRDHVIVSIYRDQVNVIATTAQPLEPYGAGTVEHHSRTKNSAFYV